MKSAVNGCNLYGALNNREKGNPERLRRLLIFAEHSVNSGLGWVGAVEKGADDDTAGGGDFVLAFEFRQAVADRPPHVARLSAPGAEGRNAL